MGWPYIPDKEAPPPDSRLGLTPAAWSIQTLCYTMDTKPPYSMEAQNDAELSQLWEREAPRLRRSLQRELDAAAAEDVVIEAFTQLAAALRRGSVESPGAWLWRAARSLLVDEAERGRREVPAGLLLDDEPIDIGQGSRPLPVSLANFPGDFDRAVRGLEDDERDAFILTELRGLSSREAADVLDVSHMTVARRRDAALTTIRSGV